MSRVQKTRKASPTSPTYISYITLLRPRREAAFSFRPLNMNLLTLTAACLLALTTAGTDLEDLAFREWKHKHGKKYSSPQEESRRLQIWLKNYISVLLHNIDAHQGLKSYRLGTNHLSDMPNEEFIKTHGFLSFANMTNIDQGTTFLKQKRQEGLPDTVDWRSRGCVTPVKNQGSCGSCWAFSSTGSLECQNFLKTGVLVSLSEQQLVDCSSSNGTRGCYGGWMQAAFQYIKINGGIDTEDSYPYEGVDGMCHYNHGNIGATCSGHIFVNPGDENDLQQAVALEGTVSVAIDASPISFQSYHSGVYNDPACSSTEVNHAVLVVGYGQENDQDYWLVKNSWGTEWGDGGYIKIARNQNNMCGISSYAIYPIV
uniref:Cathepsin L1-like n=2 Tax=Denticeps clupeoides TaxID=299321 RepID=A0AAY4A0W8_9TELE